MANTFTVEQKPLLSLLAAMQPICSKRTTLDATTYILFQVGHKELVLKSTDLEISLQASCDIKESTIAEQQIFLVQGKRIFDIVKELDGPILFTLTDSQLSLSAGKVNLALHIKDAEEFPPFPERIENLMQLDGDFLLAMLEKVAFLIPQNNANPALNGLYLEFNKEGMKMTTTDGHCLAQAYTTKYVLKEEKKWLLPRRAIIELKKIVDTDNSAVFLGICGNQLVFSSTSFNFFTKLLADPFPPYQTILNKEGFQPATLDRSQFIKTLRRSSCLLSGQFLATQFGFEQDALHVTIQNKDVGKLKEQLPLQDFSGARLDVRFYAPYLLSGLQAFSNENVTFYLNNATRPIIFEADQDDCHITYLVMPVSPTTAS